MRLGEQRPPQQLRLLDAENDCARCGRELSAGAVELCEACMIVEGQFLLHPNEGADEPRGHEAGELRD